MTLSTRMLNAALVYASRGIAVFPVWGIEGGRCACGAAECSPAKHPIPTRGFQEATTDEPTIRRWWARHPGANIATPTSWCVVVDVDRRHGGDDALALLERSHGPLPETAEVVTGSGGRHIYFARPAVSIRNSAGKI